MKKVFIKAYFKKNLGDDLFLKILSDRYQDHFYAVCSPKYHYTKYLNNINFNKSFTKYYIYRIVEKLFKKTNILEDNLLKKCDLMVNIGGSIFMEEGNWQQECKIYETSKPYYIIGANFGPYKTEEYKKIVEEKVFKRAKDICMRDVYSFEKFELPNIRYAPDIVFSLDLKDIKITNDKKAVISVMDFRNRFNNNIINLYEEKIIDLIKMFFKKGFEVTLMSFCKGEGDENEISNILLKIKDSSLKNKIKIYNYRGNIKEALNILGDSKIIVGSRFHANVLGLVMNKTIIPISYSKKTINMLKDINFKGKIIEMNKLNEFNVDSINDDDLNYKVNTLQQKEQSEKHFEKLDEILNRN